MTDNNQVLQALGIGDAMVDLFTRASQLPPLGGNIWSTAVEVHSGGTTANVAANLAKLGISSGFAGCIGDDPYGSYLIDEFKRNGVDSSRVEVIRGAYTGIILAIIDDHGERTFIACAKGAAHINLTKEYAEKLEFSSKTAIHLSGVCLVEEPARQGLLTAMQSARTLGNTIYFDPNLRLEGNFFPDSLWEAQIKAIQLAHVILIGDEEIEMLFPGLPLEEGASKILGLGVDSVIVKQGKIGASYFSKNGEDKASAFLTQVVNTSGAGDSFDAGFIAARIRNASIHDALVYANAVAAMKVGHQGSQSVPSHPETINFLINQKITIDLD